MPTPRASIIAGPARITFKGQTLFSQDDIRVSTLVRAFEVRTSGRPAQRREDETRVELTFTPNGVWAPVCALVQAFAALSVGQDVFGDADSPVIIESTDGKTYTYAAGALTAPPEIVFSAGRTLFGPLTLSAVGANNSAPTAPGRRVTVAAGVYPAGSDGYDPAAVITQPYTLSWGNAAAWINLETEAGVTVAFQPTFAPRRVDGAGIIGLRLVDLTVTARARPLDVADADVLAALKILGAGAGRGRALGVPGQDLVVSGAGVYARLYAAGLEAGRSEFGGAVNRVGELTWCAGGMVTPLCFLGTASP